jgi:hypothetical protein
MPAVSLLWPKIIFTPHVKQASYRIILYRTIVLPFCSNVHSGAFTSGAALNMRLCKIWGFNGGEYLDFDILGSDIV